MFMTNRTVQKLVVYFPSPAVQGREAKLCKEEKSLCPYLTIFSEFWEFFDITEFCSLLLFTGSKQANGEGLVEDGDIRFCSDQSFDETDLGNEDGEANEEGKEGSKNIAGHLKRIRNETCFY